MQPLADKLRPQTIDDMVGQSHIIGKGKVINKLIENNAINSLILYGPPGTGKTTLASIIAKTTDRKCIKLNAVSCGVKEIKEIIAKERNNLFSYKGIILFLDEIQAMNRKNQQALLEVIEDGSVTLIASTADNPYFVVYKALLSRCSIFEFKPINKNDIFKGLERAIYKIKDIYNIESLEFEKEALEHIAELSDGDMRTALNKLELVINVSMDKTNNSINLTLENVLNCSNKKILNIGSSDSTYDILSAFHKSVRGSNADAALHYLSKLIASGPNTLNAICRRILCIASEDVGLASPQAITIANACVQSALQLGLPEGRLPLAEATIYLSRMPKSNSIISAIDKALYDLENIDTGDIPLHLKDSHYAGAKDLGRGVEYKYPHNYPNNYVEQEYMPENLKGRIYYIPGDNKFEKSINEYWEKLKK